MPARPSSVRSRLRELAALEARREREHYAVEQAGHEADPEQAPGAVRSPASIGRRHDARDGDRPGNVVDPLGPGVDPELVDDGLRISGSESATTAIMKGTLGWPGRRVVTRAQALLVGAPGWIGQRDQGGSGAVARGASALATSSSGSGRSR